MRDDDDGLSGVAHIAQHGEKLVRLLRGENCGRLVEDEYIRAAVERLDDLDSLLLGNGHIVDLLLRIHLKAVGGAYLIDSRGYPVQVEPSGAKPRPKAVTIFLLICRFAMYSRAICAPGVES